MRVEYFGALCCLGSKECSKISGNLDFLSVVIRKVRQSNECNAQNTGVALLENVSKSAVYVYQKPTFVYDKCGFLIVGVKSIRVLEPIRLTSFLNRILRQPHLRSNKVRCNVFE